MDSLVSLRGLLGCVLALPALLMGVGGAQAQTITWTPEGPPFPEARIENTMAYDSVGQRILNFGGYDMAFNRINDLWSWNGASQTWTDLTPAGLVPPPRSGQAMAYDPTRQRVIVFGGLDDGGVWLGDTWEWNAGSGSWTSVTPGTSPSPRQGGRMVYDVLNDRMILFGGVDQNFFYPETWAWSLASRTWSQITTSASSPTSRPFVGRTFHGLVYDTSTNRVVVFGGIGYPSGGGPVMSFNDLWELRGTTWTDVTPGGTKPPTRGWMGMAYEGSRNRIVIHGGWPMPSGPSFADTWAWNGSSWTKLPNGPTIRDSHAMVWDPVRNVSVVFGGYRSDVLELNGSTWTQVFAKDWPQTQDEHSFVYDTANSRFFLFSGGGPEMWETATVPPAPTWHFPWYLAGPNGRIGHAMVYYPPRGTAVLFGGREKSNGILGPTVFGDTWEFSRPTTVWGATWTNITPGGSPPARYDHDLAGDTARNQVVLFGGRNAAGTPLGDTWVWNGSTWTPAAGGPPARYGHVMAYDTARDVIVLFGGTNGTVKLGDTWEWSGTTQAWTQRTPASAPSARVGAALARHRSGSGVVLFGGRATALLNDAWLWDGSLWTQATATGSAPFPREGARMAYDVAAGRVVLFGGRGGDRPSTEAWTATVDPTFSQLSIGPTSVTEGNAGLTSAVFPVTLSSIRPVTVAVSYATANGSAQAGSDFVASSGLVSFPPGTTARTVSISVVGDILDEPNETFFVNLSSPTNAVIAVGQGQATILDDDPTPLLSVDDVSVTEGDSGSTNATFTVSLSSPSAGTVSASYATTDNTALAGSDYTPTSGTVVFPPASTAPQNVNVPVLGDTLDEPNERFWLALSSPTNALLADPFGAGTILDDDGGSIFLHEIAQGSRQGADLQVPGPAADPDLYILEMKPYSSFEVVVDEASGDVGVGVGPRLERLALDLTTPLATSVPLGAGPGRTLRLRNPGSVPTDAYVAVSSNSCTTTCGTDDTYRIRAWETTASIPRFNNSGTQITVLLLQNSTAASISGDVYFWSGTGALLVTRPFGLAPHATLVFLTSSLPALAGQSGAITISHDGGYADLAGKAVALEPATGFSFDSPLVRKAQ